MKLTITALRQAFTLIELLVVISIIAILASMLIPVISLVRDAAIATKCVSNLRQIALAYNAYATDNEAAFPNSNLGNNKNQPNPVLLDTYVPTGFASWKCTAPRFAKGTFLYNVHWILNDVSVHWIYPGETVVYVPRIKHLTEAYIAADLDDGVMGGYHRDRSNIAMGDGHVLSRSDLSQKIPYLQVVTFANPGPTIWSEYGASEPVAGPNGVSYLRGYTR